METTTITTETAHRLQVREAQTLVGRAVTITTDRRRVTTVAGDYESGYTDVPVGTPGRIHSIESHGSRPWTRYTVVAVVNGEPRIISGCYFPIRCQFSEDIEGTIALV